MPNIRWLIGLITKVHRFVYLATGGWIGGGFLGMEFLLLHHRGRKSGRIFITPLLCIETETGFAVAGSNGGDVRFPAWWRNLQADPRVRVQHRRRHLAAVARKAEGAERKLLWERLMASYPFFDRYAEKAGREIPVVVLQVSEA